MKMEENGKTISHIDEIRKNIKSVNPAQLGKALYALKNANSIITGSEGRSKSALDIAISGLPDKEIATLGDSNLRYGNMKEAAGFLDEKMKNKKIVFLINSGSGETLTPCVWIDDLCEYIEETGTEKFTIIGFGSFPNSHIGKKIKQAKGVYVKLKGADKKPKSREQRLKSGNMNDAYELESLLLLQKVSQAINNNKGIDWIIQEIDKEIDELEKTAKEYIISNFQKNLIKKARGQGRLIFGGTGPAKKVAEMTKIRTQHIKEMIGARVFLSGSSSLAPWYDDILIVVSHSGENKSVIQWIKDYSEYDCKIFSIVGNSKSTIAEQSESFIISAPPDKFYMRASVLLSLSTIELAVHMADKGVYAPDKFMKRFHSKTE